MTTLEREARRAWRAWSAYLKRTACTRCGGWAYCGARRMRGPWLCLDCFDQEPRP